MNGSFGVNVKDAMTSLNLVQIFHHLNVTAEVIFTMEQKDIQPHGNVQNAKSKRILQIIIRPI